jgi:hypothetical protein
VLDGLLGELDRLLRPLEVKAVCVFRYDGQILQIAKALEKRT